MKCFFIFTVVALTAVVSHATEVRNIQCYKDGWAGTVPPAWTGKFVVYGVWPNQIIRQIVGIDPSGHCLLGPEATAKECSNSTTQLTDAGCAL